MRITAEDIALFGFVAFVTGLFAYDIFTAKTVRHEHHVHAGLDTVPGHSPRHSPPVGGDEDE
jgi:hypothetical protein